MNIRWYNIQLIAGYLMLAIMSFSLIKFITTTDLIYIILLVVVAFVARIIIKDAREGMK